MKTPNQLLCNHCGSNEYKKHGKAKDIQVYQCKKCHREFRESYVMGSSSANSLVSKINIENVSPEQIVRLERKIITQDNELKYHSIKFRELEKQLLEEKSRNVITHSLINNKSFDNNFKITATHKSKNEAAAVICLSDLHLEEDVDPRTVNDLNTFNPEIAETRFKKVFNNALRLIKQQQHDIDITNIILWLGGDIITGFIHPEFMESNHMSPNKAILFADRLVTWGINFLLENTKCKLTIPCSFGNHGRTTEKSRIQTAADNSFEYLLYKNLESRFIKEKRVTFKVAEGYHNYVDVFNFKIRFHHGDQMKYNGGMGGLYVPVNKAIAGWNQGVKADLDVFGHYHQLIFSGNFICNGSLIGYNAFALSIKAPFEKASQAFFLVDKDRNRKTLMAPIFVD